MKKKKKIDTLYVLYKISRSKTLEEKKGITDDNNSMTFDQRPGAHKYVYIYTYIYVRMNTRSRDDEYTIDDVAMWCNILSGGKC